MKDVSIELVVFGVLILVIVLDLLIKGRKKKQDIQDESNLIKGKETTDAKKSSSFKGVLNYFIERPKNIVLYFMSILITKLLIHYVIYPEKWEVDIKGSEYKATGNHSFGYHLDNIFELEVQLFIHSFVIISFLAWQFNSYLKKR